MQCKLWQDAKWLWNSFMVLLIQTPRSWTYPKAGPLYIQQLYHTQVLIHIRLFDPTFQTLQSYTQRYPALIWSKTMFLVHKAVKWPWKYVANALCEAISSATDPVNSPCLEYTAQNPFPSTTSRQQGKNCFVVGNYLHQALRQRKGLSLLLPSSEVQHKLKDWLWPFPKAGH